jgi:hypothetical protein
MIKITREITCDFCREVFFKDDWTLAFNDIMPTSPQENRIGRNYACDDCVGAAKEAALARGNTGIKWEVEP